MSPGRLEYYSNDKKREKKGEVIIDGKSEIASLSDYKSVLSKMEHRFKLSNLPSLEIEMCAGSEDEKQVPYKNRILTFSGISLSQGRF